MNELDELVGTGVCHPHRCRRVASSIRPTRFLTRCLISLEGRGRGVNAIASWKSHEPRGTVWLGAIAHHPDS